jgi:hypothetical protein
MVNFYFDRRNFTVDVIEQDNFMELDFNVSQIFESKKNKPILEKYVARSFDQLIQDVKWSLKNIKKCMASEAYEYGGGIWYKLEVEEISWKQKRIRYILKAAQLKKKKCKVSDNFKEESQKFKNEIDYLDDLRKIAASKGGKCLSNRYFDNKTKLKFVCQKGHKWWATPNNIKDGTWCPDCYLKKDILLNQLKEIVEMKGGVCLSNEYVNSHSHLHFRCKLGHEWEATPNNIKNGKWCPKCSQSRSERICRKFFEVIFEEKFPQTKFKWLINNDGNIMHLDGYNSKLRLAFEYNGIQHYKFKKNWFKTEDDFEKQQFDDKTKKILCLANKITLIVIPYTIKFDELENHIIKAAKRAGIFIKERKEKIEWRKFEVYSPNKLKILKEIAIKRGGKLLSKFYYNNRTKLRFQRSKGHIWEARPYRIKAGDWCPECYQEQNEALKKKKNQELLEIILSKNGRLLSNYDNRRTKVRIQCSQGHIWETLPNNIKSGSWCPECHHNKDYYLNEIKELARQKGGKCLSNEYVNNKIKLRFICEMGHKWFATPKSIKEGTWCPHCYKLGLN